MNKRLQLIEKTFKEFLQFAKEEHPNDKVNAVLLLEELCANLVCSIVNSYSNEDEPKAFIYNMQNMTISLMKATQFHDDTISCESNAGDTH